MDSNHLRTLEFPKILAQLARHTSFSAGRQRAIALQPSPVLAEVQVRLQETREARHLLDTGAAISLGGVRDIRPLAQNAQRGAILQPSDLLNIQDTLRAGSRIQRALTRKKTEVPLLADIASRIEPCEELTHEIERCISAQGDVVDDATASLARIRREMRTAHERLMEKLNRILASPSNASFLQEALVTQRAGRYVIPVKADFKGRIPGIVHDTSASGATLFIEPLSAVELGNRWRQSRIEEEKEVERILAALSSLVADEAESLAWTVEALAELDVAMAKARYATVLDASEPRIAPFDAEGPPGHPGTTMVLRQARHPLLDPESVVPIDIHLSDDYFILVITGPNTGGKTVSLKTVGLMAAMAQSGLHLPIAEQSALSVFDAIYADIGDEQSIEQSLSTFSSHMTNIIRILKSATSRSLLLFDELGAGTDPVEGSALARAILSHLLAHRLTSFVATHYSELKTFAHTTLGVENASVEFSLETLAPTYKLNVGLPGRSNAFAIAQRLGLQSDIVDEARSLVSREELATESLLAEIQQAHQEAARARDEALLTQRLLEEEQNRVASHLAAIGGERAAILGEARAKARRELAEVRKEIQAIEDDIAGRRSQGTLGEKWLAEARARLAEKEEAVRALQPRALSQETAIAGALAVGDRVWVEGLGTTGEVTALDGDSAEVQVGSFHVRVEQSSLERRAGPEPSAQDREFVSKGFHPSPGIELDLRGQRVEEALPRVDKYLDDAFLAGLEFVRLIHGKGTGALRQAVRQQLRNHALVESHRPGEQGEGGTGVTVAYLIKA